MERSPWSQTSMWLSFSTCCPNQLVNCHLVWLYNLNIGEAWSNSSLFWYFFITLAVWRISNISTAISFCIYKHANCNPHFTCLNPYLANPCNSSCSYSQRPWWPCAMLSISLWTQPLNQAVNHHQCLSFAHTAVWCRSSQNTMARTSDEACSGCFY